MNNNEFASASRREIQLTPQIIDGSVPEGLYGVVFISSACGTVNTEGMPYPSQYADGSSCQEYGSPLINGDGMLYRIDFSESGRIAVRNGLLKPPCYYADLATSEKVNPGNPWADLEFNNLGLARISMKLGTRNELNTAVTPIRFKREGVHRLLATFDAGRPFEFDPEKLELITAIGRNTAWNSGLPPFLKQPLAMVLTTAHPVFDPDTEELFTVNFTKTDEQLMKATHVFGVLFHDMDWLAAEFRKLIHALEGKTHEEKVQQTAAFLDGVHLRSPKKNPTWLHKIWNWIKQKCSNFLYSHVTNRNEVRVLRWQGNTELDAWTITDENGDPIDIDYNMHQIGLSKDYLVLCDTNFKFTLDVMVNFPFQNDPIIDRFIRELLGGAINDFSHLYLVKRSDLKPGGGKVRASKTRLPLETVHFSVDYENPNGQITIHTAHNCSACPAEWLRTYDEPATGSNVKIDQQKIGLMAVGEMDIGKIGRVVVDGNTGAVMEEQTRFLHLTGEKNGAISEAHTWAVGLYTYRDMLSPDYNVPKIEHVYWQSYGLREDCLTKYIYDLYKDPKRNRTFTAEEMLAYTRMGACFVLQCVETESLSSVDHYTFARDQYFWSLQFVPFKEARPGVPDSKNGCILTTVITGSADPSGHMSYSRELWLFDANNLAAGPICRMAHPDLVFGFTIHSVWVSEAGSVPKPSYVLPVREDYDAMIAQMPESDNLRSRTQDLFNQKVYPYFESAKS